MDSFTVHKNGKVTTNSKEDSVVSFTLDDVADEKPMITLTGTTRSSASAWLDSGVIHVSGYLGEVSVITYRDDGTVCKTSVTVESGNVLDLDPGILAK